MKTHPKISYDRLSSKRHVDFLSVDGVPLEEDCTQVGGSLEEMRAECNAYINQLIRKHGEPPTDASFTIVSNPHDFGTYYDVAVVFNPDKEEAGIYAYKVENDLPEYWDSEALAELKAAEHSNFLTPLRKLKAA